MKILIIGNGFDLDHGLETGYSQFLNFCDNLILFKNSNTFNEKCSDSQKKYITELKKDRKWFDKLNKCLEGNKLFNYLSKINESNNWIDLEAEIQKIINDLDYLNQVYINSHQESVDLPKGNKPFNNIVSIFGDPNAVKSASPSECKKVIHSWLLKLTLVLEIYIARFINYTDVEYYSPDIMDFDADRVISFNYSNTYDRIYSTTRDVSLCNYIHGKATTNNNINIVLGITDSNSLNDKDSSNCEFEKYFQRIEKKTSDEYTYWIASEEKKEIMFFGHSLYSSDGDIIEELINESESVKIVYYNETMLKNIIKNLTEILGKSKLIDYSYGYNPKIEFIKQKEHANSYYGGLEVLNDIQMLKKLHNQSFNKVNDLLDKIEDKISLNDLTYFHSQSVIIELFYCLLSINPDYNKLSEKLLDISKTLKYKHTSSGPIDFSITSYNIPKHKMDTVHKILSAFISAINADNRKRFNINNSNNWNKIYEKEKSLAKAILWTLSYISSDSGWYKVVQFLLDFDNEYVMQTFDNLQKSDLNTPKMVRLNHLYDLYQEKYKIDNDIDDLPF